MIYRNQTTIGINWILHPTVIKKDLNANLNKLTRLPLIQSLTERTNRAAIMPKVKDEIFTAFEGLFPWNNGTLAAGKSIAPM